MQWHTFLKVWAKPHAWLGMSVWSPWQVHIGLWHEDAGSLGASLSLTDWKTECLLYSLILNPQYLRSSKELSWQVSWSLHTGQMPMCSCSVGKFSKFCREFVAWWVPWPSSLPGILTPPLKLMHILKLWPCRMELIKKLSLVVAESKWGALSSRASSRWHGANYQEV